MQQQMETPNQTRTVSFSNLPDINASSRFLLSNLFGKTYFALSVAKSERTATEERRRSYENLIQTRNLRCEKKKLRKERGRERS